MKKIPTFIVYIIICFLININNLYSDYVGDFLVRNLSSNTMNVIVQSVSIPFEGSTDSTYFQQIRIDEIQAGVVFKGVNGYYPIFNKTTQGNYGVILDMGHCATNEYLIGSPPHGAWGFAKYKVEIVVQNDTFKCFFNCLDSRYSKIDSLGVRYSRDWEFVYDPAFPSEYKVRLKLGIGSTVYDSLKKSEMKEFKPWKILYGRDNPFSTNFYFRTTPFGISPRYIETFNVTELHISTEVKLDTVFQYLGSSDNYGYNTIDSSQFYYYYTDPPIDSISNQHGNTYCTPAWRYYSFKIGDYVSGLKLTADSGSKLILEKDKKLWISGQILEPNSGGDTLLLRNASNLQLDVSAKIFTYNGGAFIDSGSNRKWNDFSSLRAFEGTSLGFYGNQDTVNNGGFIVIDGDADLKLGNNTTLTFDGANTFLWLKPNSNVILGQNARLVFKNGAYIKADSSSFVSYNGTSKWKGIRLENSGEDSITYCSFENTDTCIFVDNVNECEARVKKVIIGNTFDDGMVVLKNIFYCNFSGNIFNASNSQLYLLHVNNNVHPYDFDACDEAANPASDFAINITKNSFTGGVIQIYLNCLASSFTPFYVAENYFNGALSFPRIGIVTNKSTGSIKNNIFTSDDYDFSFRFYQSDFCLYGNTVLSEYNDVELFTSSGANLGPVSSSGSKYWYGGGNSLTSTGGGNIEFDEGSDLLIDSGKNCLTVPEEYYHIIGIVTGNCTGRTFAARKNLWNPFPPAVEISCSSTNVTLLYTPYNSECENTEEPDDYELTDMGDGIIDSVIITSTGGGGGNSGKSNLYNPKIESYDEDNYTEAIQKRKQKDYEGAINLLKNILDDYDTSKFLNSAVSELFLNYSLNDTGSTQSQTTQLFNELEGYLEEKMEQYQSNNSFIEKAYSIYLMCLTKSLDYNEAISGYENIMLNHPDTTRRLLASWDRSAVVLLQQGSGGGDNLSPEQRLKKLFRDEPVHKLVNKVFKRMMKKEVAKQKDVRRTDKRKEMKSIESRVTRFNPGTAEELDQKISKDFELLLALDKTQSHKEQNLVPKEYKLNQNYPNPFNPTTTISYEIPTDGLVKLKIFDITGREVMILVNEYKQAGSYHVNLNGSNLSSGIYFYKLEAGEFVETRKMVLLK